MKTFRATLSLVALFLITAGAVAAQQGGMEETNPRRADEGEGPHERLILRGGTYIDGAGSPPLGPVDIVVENDRIVEIRAVGFPMAPINENRRPDGATREIDVSGMYILPGFVDMHAHTGGAGKAPQAEYTHKLWLANGITTSRGVGHGPMMWALEQKALSERERDRRTADVHVRAPRVRRGTRARSTRPRRPVSGCAGPRGRRRRRPDRRPEADVVPARNHGGADRRGAPARPRHRRPPGADGRGPDERARRRRARPRHDDPLLRSLRGAVRGSDDPGLPGRLQLPERAAPIRPGRSALGAVGRARLRRLERAHRPSSSSSTSGSTRR